MHSWKNYNSNSRGFLCSSAQGIRSGICFLNLFYSQSPIVTTMLSPALDLNWSFCEMMTLFAQICQGRHQSCIFRKGSTRELM
jgi:hypothetical protein